MRITVILPNADWAHSAGVRIRYRRIMPPLQAAGHSLDLVALADLAEQDQFDADAYLFCKCHDVRAVLLAHKIRTQGRASIGVDIFDDYFSQTSDARFTHMRDWLGQMRGGLDFWLCATPAMQTALAQTMGGLPCHVMNDPFGGFDPAALAETLARNAADARASRIARIGWFGTGDNPDFPVGLHDLSALGGALAGVTRAGYDTRLTILTNRRAMDANRLAMLSRLPVPWTIEEWSTEAEAQLIQSSLACVLPVNGQGFSAVKSLNRAVSTLTGGAQVLSLGYPLYAALDEVIYRDPATLIAELEADQLRLRPDTLPRLSGLLDQLGNPEIEAAGLARFLGGLTMAHASNAPAPGAVILGLRVAPDLAHGVQALGQMVVANPFAPGKGPRDVQISFDGAGGVAVVLSALAYAQLGVDHAQACADGDPGTHLLTLAATALPRPAFGPPWSPGDAPKPLPRLALFAHYGPVMADVALVLGHLFPACPIRLAEQSAPYRWQSAPVAA